MYSYTFSEDTGGIILNSSPTESSKEPRPVYANEMDSLGFDQFWDYDKQNEVPYMWAESTTYWYRGIKIAKIKGGDLFNKPELIPIRNDNSKTSFDKKNKEVLKPIDISLMNKRNEELLKIIEQSTIKKIVKAYEKYKDKLDIFHVAFSGGKDSAVLLYLVEKALPKDSFVVIFGDTGMEFPDTYEVIDKTRNMCKEKGIHFYTAKSNFETEDTWKIFGPPARVLRWCCHVHKTSPQTLKMREITGKEDYVGLDFVGVRAYESLSRSKYKYENFSKKQKGQYSFNPILEWTSAEIWSYIYLNNININNTYKKGNSRAGCLLCPMGGGASNYFRRNSYPDEVNRYMKIIGESYNSENSKDIATYINNGGWNARMNGRDLANNPSNNTEINTDTHLIIKVKNEMTDWKEWIKTIGDLQKIGNEYAVTFEGEKYFFNVLNNENGYEVKIKRNRTKKDLRFLKLFKQVFRKAAYCYGCRVCETNCRYGCLKFIDGKLKIENCIHCYECHSIDSGCIRYHSLRHPQGGGRKMKKSLNSFGDHAPKTSWLIEFFEKGDSFFDDNALGPMMFSMFKRFLRDAELIEKNKVTPFFNLIQSIGWDSDVSLGLILTNLAMNNPEIAWYIENLDLNVIYQRDEVVDMLSDFDVNKRNARSIVNAFKRICETPFGSNLNFGYVSEDYELQRTKCTMSDPRVFLYALFKFSEVCNLDSEFHVAYLLNSSIERNGVSPLHIFGLTDMEEIKSILLGLSMGYPEFINAVFTNDLKTVSLREKSSEDVLNLFERN